MSTLRESAQQALEALEAALGENQPYFVKCGLAMVSLRAALEQPEQEIALTIGPFYLKRYDEHSFLLGHESGEGMQVRDHRVLEIFNELWKEF
jgi:hypothetical protein